MSSDRPRAPSLRVIARLSMLSCALLLQACGTVRGPSPGAPIERPLFDRGPLAVEREWLQSWFQGTPVLIAPEAGGAVGVEVPAEFSFDAGRSRIKPPLAAVLDKVAESMRRVPQARVALLAAPRDGAAGTALALKRAVQMRDHLRSRGVLTSRMAAPTAAPAAAVQLRLEAVDP